MNTDIPVQLVVAIGTVVAALITGMIALVNLTLSKEQKISEFRQAWIDGLRDDLSKYFSALRFLTDAAFASSFYSASHAETVFPRTPTQIAELRVVVVETLSRIRLRLNPQETDHVELLRLLEVVQAKCRAIGPTNLDTAEAARALDVAAEFARPVLKSEWKRVKKGEPAFTLLRIWLIPALLVLSAGFATLIVFGEFR